MKKETLQEYLARGGTITVCPPKTTASAPKRRSSKPAKEVSEINLQILPTNVKIALGIK